MCTFEQLQKANETIKTTDIKGKAYAEVNQRIKAFRIIYPDGFIRTEIISNENGVCIMKACVGYESEGRERILGTGTAYEKEGSSFINDTSYIENCETSAVGRALGMAGIGIDTSVASLEEVQNAIIQQEDIKKKQQEAMKKKQEAKQTTNEIKEGAMRAFLIEHEIAPDWVCKMYKIKDLNDLKDAQAAAITNNIAKFKEEFEKAKASGEWG
jgi:hypothetical protein